MKRKSWWNQLQSGDYPKTQLKYGDSNWVTYRLPKQEPSKITGSSNVQSNKKCPNCDEWYERDKKQCPKCNWPSIKNINKKSIKTDISEPENTIINLRRKLDKNYNEIKLYEILSNGLIYLRKVYLKNKSLFSPEHIIFLQKVNEIMESLGKFIELKEKAIKNQDIEKSRKIINEMAFVRMRLMETRIAKLIEKEMHNLFTKIKENK